MAFRLSVIQQEAVDLAIRLEKEYGVGNVFLRHTGVGGVKFVTHRVGEESSTVLTQYKKVNGKTVNALENRGLLQCQDKHHKNLPTYRTYLRVESQAVGSRIKTELF